MYCNTIIPFNLVHYFLSYLCHILNILVTWSAIEGGRACRTRTAAGLRALHELIAAHPEAEFYSGLQERSLLRQTRVMKGKKANQRDAEMSRKGFALGAMSWAR